MNIVQILFFTVVAFSSAQHTLDASKECDLVVNTTVKNPSNGKTDGQITFVIANDVVKDRYKIFLVNKGSDISRNEIKGLKIIDLAAGFYDFIVIDTKGDKCIKEITIVLK